MSNPLLLNNELVAKMINRMCDNYNRLYFLTTELQEMPPITHSLDCQSEGSSEINGMTFRVTNQYNMTITTEEDTLTKEQVDNLRKQIQQRSDRIVETLIQDRMRRVMEEMTTSYSMKQPDKFTQDPLTSRLINRQQEPPITPITLKPH